MGGGKCFQKYFIKENFGSKLCYFSPSFLLLPMDFSLYVARTTLTAIRN